MYKRDFLKIVGFLVFCHFSYAQELQIRGLITEDGGLPAPGIIVKNLANKKLAYSNFDGVYEIKAKIGDTLKFFISEKLENCFEVKYRTVTDNPNINVQILSKEILKNELCKKKPKELFIFIGKLIDSERDNGYDECYINMNSNIIAEFKVFEQFYGDLNIETISFKDSDHASFEPFPYLNTKFSLLFVVKYCDEFYLKSSRDIYKTINGKWALAYNSKNYSNIKDGSSHLENIMFKNSAKILPKRYNKKHDSILLKEPYYEIKGNYFKPLIGNYVKDYVDLWIKNDAEFQKSNVKE